MTLHEFRLLTDEEQKKIIYDEGIYIGKRKLNGQTVLAYQLEDFYIEIFFTVYRMHISRMSCFRNTNRLEPYLVHMNIEELLKTELKK
ncbi:MAG TPA: hypothetical protein VEX63_04590 [Flavisolibacter sp.]|jgi:hypothetical protein|nr:hypothetical protein [Flavisolibacter sp.]